MSICDKIVRSRLGGQIDVSSVLNEGTTVEVTVPVDFVGANETGVDAELAASSFDRRVVSDELARLFSPVMGLDSPTPAEELPAFDFSSSIRNARDTLHLDKQLGANEADSMAIDFAKLQIASQTQADTPLRALAARAAADGTPELATPSGSRPESRDGLVPGLTRLRVMVVDDNSIARTVLARLLAAKVRHSISAAYRTKAYLRLVACRASSTLWRKTVRRRWRHTRNSGTTSSSWTFRCPEWCAFALPA